MPRNPVITLFLVLLLIPCHTYSRQRTLEISGLKIYTEMELADILNIDHYEDGRMSAKEVIDSIVAFYSNNGYTLVKIYVFENSDTALRIYVDEGALGKIIFYNMDDFTTIFLKIVFRFPNKIFNKYVAEENISKLKKIRSWKNIDYKLWPMKEYDLSIFQLDRELNLPLLGKKVLPFFDRYSPRYDLIVLISKSIAPVPIDEQLKDLDLGKFDGGKDGKDDTKKEIKKKDSKTKKRVLNKFDYGLKVHFYKGFIPYLKYSHLGMLASLDFFMAETSLGVMYGIDRKFKRPPRITYFNFNASYFFTPTFRDIFTPLVRLDVFRSKTGRPDLGLIEYNFTTINALFAPGITLLSKINTYIGLGIENVFFESSKLNYLKLTPVDPISVLLGRDPIKEFQQFRQTIRFFNEIKKRVEIYPYVQFGVIYDFTQHIARAYELRKNRIRKEIAATYDFYFFRQMFHQFRVMGYFEYEFKDRSIYSGILTYQLILNDPPFYHESSVTSLAFKGLNGKLYFSKNVLAQSNEYRVSVYRDFIYIGVFFDMTLFEGSGRDLKGAQFAFVGGPTARVLFLDHFELYLQYGWDYLVSTRKSKGYFYFNIQNKW